MRNSANTMTLGGQRGHFRTAFIRHWRLRTIPQVVVFFHGGAWGLGDLDTHDCFCRIFANESGCRLFSIDYRLAPEHPFPAAVEDACAATAWIGAHAAELAIAPNCLAVAGDSAGGTLAAVVCQRAKDFGFKIALQVLLCPVTDIAPDTQSRREF